MKLCKDCKHSRRNLMLGQSFAKCAATVDLNTGKPHSFCENERLPEFDSINKCGSTGKLWEQRVSVWARLKAWVRS